MFLKRLAFLRSAGLGLATLALLGLGGARPAHAVTSVTFTGSAPAGGGLTTFNYTFTFRNLLGVESLRSGDFLTFYDVGTVTGSGPSTLTFTQALVGPTDPSVTPTDSPTVLNGTFTYTGPTVTRMTDFAVSLTSTASTTRSGQYTSTNTVLESTLSQIGSVTLPNASGPAAVPEPSQTAALGLGLLGLSGLMLKARKRKASAGV